MPQIKLLEKHDNDFVIERNGERIRVPRMPDGVPTSNTAHALLLKTEAGQVVEGWEF